MANDKVCYGVYRVLKNGKLRYVSRSATHNKKLAEEIAAMRSRGEGQTPWGAIRPIPAYLHVVKEIA